MQLKELYDKKYNKVIDYLLSQRMAVSTGFIINEFTNKKNKYKVLPSSFLRVIYVPLF